MIGPISQRLLTVLQLTRMALVFTAISDSVCALLLSSRARAGFGPLIYSGIDASHFVAVVAMSVGLYGFGMCLNDIIDRRRDLQMAAHRPLPSGRIGVQAAHAIAIVFLFTALAGGVVLAQDARNGGAGWMSLGILVWTCLLIAFYDFAGKYLVAPGLITLGMIRFFHATIPAPTLPVIWHPLLLLNHVTVLSAVAYRWEQKRPPLTKVHWWGLGTGLLSADVACVLIVGLRRAERMHASLAEALWVTPALLIPAAAAVGFVLLAFVIRRRFGNSPRSGQALMLYGLLWLVVYDACFVLAYVGIPPAMMLVALLPLAYLSVQIMRWWSKIISLSQEPEYQRAR